MALGARLLLLFPLLAVVLLVGLLETDAGEAVRGAWIDGVRELAAVFAKHPVDYPPHVLPMPSATPKGAPRAHPDLTFLALFLAGVLAFPGTWKGRGLRTLLGLCVLFALDAWRLVVLAYFEARVGGGSGSIEAVLWPAPLVVALVLLLLAARPRPQALTS